jgi:hypothetical protein
MGSGRAYSTPSPIADSFCRGAAFLTLVNNFLSPMYVTTLCHATEPMPHLLFVS